MQTCTEKDCTYAGFWVRLAAFALDSAILAMGTAGGTAGPGRAFRTAGTNPSGGPGVV